MAVIARLKEHRNKSPKAHTVNNLSAVIPSFNMRGRERMMLTAFRKSGILKLSTSCNPVPVRGWSQDDARKDLLT